MAPVKRVPVGNVRGRSRVPLADQVIRRRRASQIDQMMRGLKLSFDANYVHVYCTSVIHFRILQSVTDNFSPSSYMFDYPGSFVAHYLLGLTGHPDPTPEKFATTDNPGIDPAEYDHVSQLSLDLWASFARDGDPSIDRQDWPAYTAENDTYLRIDLTPAVETGLDEAFPEISFPIPTP